MKFITIRVSKDAHAALKEVSKRTGVKLWFAAQKAATDLLRQVIANGK